MFEQFEKYGPPGGTVPTGKDSQVDNLCACAEGCGAVATHDIGGATSPHWYWYTMFCPPWQPWCNMDIWDECLQQKLQTKNADGTPWTWFAAV